MKTSPKDIEFYSTNRISIHIHKVPHYRKDIRAGRGGKMLIPKAIGVESFLKP